MRLYRGGDQEAFRKLYERHRGPLIRFVRRTAFDNSDAEEIIQETRSHARSARDYGRQEGATRYYLMNVAEYTGPGSMEHIQ
jgi:RNA polymerase sigma-70 factor (ECF subfamily)